MYPEDYNQNTNNLDDLAKKRADLPQYVAEKGQQLGGAVKSAFPLIFDEKAQQSSPPQGGGFVGEDLRNIMSSVQNFQESGGGSRANPYLTEGVPSFQSNLATTAAPATTAKENISPSAIRGVSGEAQAATLPSEKAAPATELRSGGYLQEVGRGTPLQNLNSVAPTSQAAAAPAQTGFANSLANLRNTSPTPQMGRGIQVIRGSQMRTEMPVEDAEAGKTLPPGAVVSGAPYSREPSRPNVASPENMAIYNKRMDNYKAQQQNLADIEKARLAGEYGLKTETAKSKSAMDLKQLEFKTAHAQDKELQRRWNAKQGDYLISQYLAGKEGESISPHHDAIAQQVRRMAIEDPRGAEAFVQQELPKAHFLSNFDKDTSGVKANITSQILSKVDPAYRSQVTQTLGTPGNNPAKINLLLGHAFKDQALWDAGLKSLGLGR